MGGTHPRPDPPRTLAPDGPIAMAPVGHPDHRDRGLLRPAQLQLLLLGWRGLDRTAAPHADPAVPVPAPLSALAQDRSTRSRRSAGAQRRHHPGLRRRHHDGRRLHPPAAARPPAPGVRGRRSRRHGAAPVRRAARSRGPGALGSCSGRHLERSAGRCGAAGGECHRRPVRPCPRCRSWSPHSSRPPRSRCHRGPTSTRSCCRRRVRPPPRRSRRGRRSSPRRS